MFALLGFICFVLDEFDVKVGNIEWLALGLAFIALHLALSGMAFGRGWLPMGRRKE